MELSRPNWSRTGNKKLLLPGERRGRRLQLALPVQKCGFAIRLFELAQPLYHMCQLRLSYNSDGSQKGLRYRCALCRAPPNHREYQDSGD